MTVEEIAAKLRERVAGSSFDKSVKFVLGGDGVVVLDGTNVSTQDAPTDCTITVSRENFEELVAGDMSPTAAFMTGKLKVEGDMSAAMAVSQLL
ncbi:SCP2 sterol-binding domain-containing protein [Tianweitania sediminis]|jgi:putative sterol carrier protein|uniref:SCP2 sterol-binding domain-containing protein n=1 Tax=Tianweitania sediminis TaxID=1502156 RepID=A0A8J7R9D7_9HYPH|nr:SCP2 sterol-binding domain-containing protein [Tianweitania sediminis]MBP0441265.1 SCP2 sterol-binding domain-containing protein [Tianweitania sediminis]HEV7416713.1 SCP2 sterol-binding domain-containing protein [Tianweitania sediminis]